MLWIHVGAWIETQGILLWRFQNETVACMITGPKFGLVDVEAMAWVEHSGRGRLARSSAMGTLGPDVRHYGRVTIGGIRHARSADPVNGHAVCKIVPVRECSLQSVFF